MMTSTLIILDGMRQNRRYTYTVFTEDRMEMNVIQISLFLWFGCYDVFQNGCHRKFTGRNWKNSRSIICTIESGFLPEHSMASYGVNSL